MSRKRNNSKGISWIIVAVFAVAVFAAVPFVGDWIADAILPPQQNQPSVQEDTTPPTAQPKNVTVYAPGALKASDFVENIVDASEVTVTFVTEPDWSKEGAQAVTVRLTDAAGNSSLISSTLTFIVDKQAPVISGVRDVEVYVGDTVSYRKGITVTDDMDAAPVLEIDQSTVNLAQPGVYTVTYRATDAAGNVATLTMKLTVKVKPLHFVEPDVIYARVDALLDKFITEDMTHRQKAEAVYVWTRRESHIGPGHFTYSGSTSRHDDYLQAAYEFLENKKGDCFYFYAIQKLMLERLNIPTIDVQKVKNFPEDSNHYWLLVSVDGGKSYYHYDNVWSWELCLVTDRELDALSSTVDSNPFNRDKSLYPATPVQKLPESTLPWDNAAIANAKP